jgi:hypothetical protein
MVVVEVCRTGKACLASRLPARLLREPNPEAGEVLTAIFCLLF